MTKTINRAATKAIDNFLIASNTGHISVKVEEMDGRKFNIVTSELFAHIDDTKRVISFLRSKGHDPFKRGTKEPAAIAATLSTASWDDMKNIDPKTSAARSMFD